MVNMKIMSVLVLRFILRENDSEEFGKNTHVVRPTESDVNSMQRLFEEYISIIIQAVFQIILQKHPPCV
jgi:hypothetical protein